MNLKMIFSISGQNWLTRSSSRSLWKWTFSHAYNRSTDTDGGKWRVSFQAGGRGYGKIRRYLLVVKCHFLSSLFKFRGCVSLSGGERIYWPGGARALPRILSICAPGQAGRALPRTLSISLARRGARAPSHPVYLRPCTHTFV